MHRGCVGAFMCPNWFPKELKNADIGFLSGGELQPKSGNHNWPYEEEDEEEDSTYQMADFGINIK